MLSSVLDLLAQSNAVVRGIILGLLIAMPVGPIGILCIRRTLERGLSAGFATGLGAALADGLFAAVAGFGLTSFMYLLRDYQTILTYGGGALLLVMAVTTYRSRPAPQAPGVAIKGAIPAFTSGFLLTLTNPVTMLAIFGVITGLGQVASASEAARLIVGVYLGSALWWLFLSGMVALSRRHLPEGLTLHINRAAAIVLAAFGVYTLLAAGFTEPVIAGF